MTLRKRLYVGLAALMCAASLSAPAAAAPPKALSDSDAQAYATAFHLVEAGDFLGAQLAAAEAKDQSLSGYLSFKALMHPTAHKAGFEELVSWLGRFRDLPVAEKVFSLASKRKPPEAPAPPVPEVAGLNSARSEITKPAREAFYSGDVRRAFALSVQVGERWIAGLSAWRLADYAQAQDYFAQVAADEEEDPWLRAAGAYWAGRSAAALGDGAAANAFLRVAAQAPHTFYGMIAQRQMQLFQVAEANTGQVTLASYRAPKPARARPALDADLVVFTATNPRAHRAAALAQIGRYEEARQELRAGLALARTGEDRKAWQALIAAVGATPAGSGGGRYLTLGEYQAPPLEPQDGFTVDKALVYAIVRQESAFNPMAVSPVGAIGLMQLMPGSAALALGDDKLKRNAKPLFDPAFNLKAGQAYLGYLMDRGVGTDLLRIVAAYNAGPGAVLKTERMLRHDDPLLFIECLPALETRNYVEKVVVNYWTYKRMFGGEAKTLDAIATGAPKIDVRLDLPYAPAPQPQIASQPVQLGALQPSALD